MNTYPKSAMTMLILSCERRSCRAYEIINQWNYLSDTNILPERMNIIMNKSQTKIIPELHAQVLHKLAEVETREI